MLNTNPSTDNIVAGDQWTFDQSVTSAFDDMLSRSIPQYEVMRKAVFDLGSVYVQGNTMITDLGCSRGEALFPFVERFAARNGYLGVEISMPMLEAAKQRFQDNPRVLIQSLDLRTQFPARPSSVILSILTLQFIPIEYRQNVLRQIYNNLLPGGAFLIVEKVLGATAELNSQMVDHYYALKGMNGYSPEQIERKRLSLEGVLVPVTAKWNEDMLKDAGFNQVDCFWRWMNFAGWIAIKK